MKKLLLVINLMALILLGCGMSALADAITYDMEEAGYYVYVATPDGGLNMRFGPGTEYEKVMQERIPDNVKLYIGYVSGNWGYTSYNGNEGWVALKQTTKTPPAPPATKKPEPAPTPVPAVNTPAVTQSVQNTEIAATDAPLPVEDAETDIEGINSKDAEIVKNSMLSQIILIAILVLLFIIIAILLVILINRKSNKKF